MLFVVHHDIMSQKLLLAINIPVGMLITCLILRSAQLTPRAVHSLRILRIIDISTLLDNMDLNDKQRGKSNYH